MNERDSIMNAIDELVDAMYEQGKKDGMEEERIEQQEGVKE